MIREPRAKGIDISAVGQGKFNWEQWRGHIDFALCKATEGTGFIDPQYERNRSYARELDIVMGAYHYGHPDEDPSLQARHFTDVIKSFGDTDVIMMLDIEENDGLSPHDVAFWSWTFTRECDRFTPGMRPVRAVLVYSYTSFILDGNLAMSGGQPLNISQPERAQPTPPPPWHNWAFWQYAIGSRFGAPNLDEYNGTLKDLQKFVRG